MNPIKFIVCLFRGHQWSDTMGHWSMCWRCKMLRKKAHVDHITVSDKGISAFTRRVEQPKGKD